MQYRQNRRSLEESLKTTIEVDTLEELIYYINKHWQDFDREVEEIKFEHPIFDERVGWYSYYVMVKFKGHDRYIPVGMSDGKF